MRETTGWYRAPEKADRRNLHEKGQIEPRKDDQARSQQAVREKECGGEYRKRTGVHGFAIRKILLILKGKIVNGLVSFRVTFQ